MALVDIPRSKLGASNNSSSSSKYHQNSLKSSSSTSKLAPAAASDVQPSAVVNTKKSSPNASSGRKENKQRRSPAPSASKEANPSGNDSAAKASVDAAAAAPSTAGVSAPPPIINPDFPNMPRLYRKVEINLENSLLNEDKLNNGPSLQDGMSSDLEQDLRFLGCELIQSASIMLKLPQVAAATGQILYQRFYYSKSFVRYFFEHTAMACINLASKIEEAPRRVRDVVNVFHHLRQLYRIRQLEKRSNSKKLENRRPTPMLVDSKYSTLKNDVIKAERRVLKELGFCVHVKHPHKLIPTYMRALNAEDNQALAQKSWNYMNDSLRSDIFLRFSPETVACACIHLASLNLQIPTPKVVVPSSSNVLNWWQLFTNDDVPDVSLSLLKLYAYRRKKLSWDELEAKVSKLRQRLIEKQAADKISGGIENTPNPHAAVAAPNTAPTLEKTSSSAKLNDREKTKREDCSENEKRKVYDQKKQDEEIIDRQRVSPRSYSSSRKKLKSSPKSRESRKLAKKERTKSKENRRDRSTRPISVISIDEDDVDDEAAIKRRTKMNGNVDDYERYENRTNYYRKSSRSPSRHRDKKYRSRSPRSRSPPSQYKRSKGGDLKR